MQSLDAVREMQVAHGWAKHRSDRTNYRKLKSAIRAATWRERMNLRFKLSEAQNWRCCYCGCRMEGYGCELNATTLERILPAPLGCYTEDNSVVACLDCNTRRGNAIWPQHIDAMAAITGLDAAAIQNALGVIVDAKSAVAA